MNKGRNNQKGFTLVELLATITILALVVSITIYIAINVITNAKAKTYQVAMANVIGNADSYLIENSNRLFFVADSNNTYEYQCLTVQDLIDYGYLKENVTESKIAENRTVLKSDYIYVERDIQTKAIVKKAYVLENGEYANVCNVVIKVMGNITFTSSPAASMWAREKEITITYKLNNLNNINELENYHYNYTFDNTYDVVSDEGAVKKIKVTADGTINANIKYGDEIITIGSYVVSKIDKTGPVITLASNPTGYLYNSAKLALKVTDTKSGVNYSSFSKGDIEVTIGGENITNFTLTKKDNNGNYVLEINDTTHSGKVEIKIKENSVFDNVENGNIETILKPTAEWMKVAAIPTATGYCSNPTYTGSSQVIVKSEGAGYTWSNGTQRTNAGSQNVTATLSTEYIWSDGTVANKTISCKINKADPTCPTLTAYSGTYDGKGHTITVSGGSGGTLQYRKIINGTTNEWTTTNPQRVSAGTTTVEVKIVGDSNHNDKSCGSKDITISKKTITVKASNQSKTYTGSALSADATCAVTLGSLITGHTLTCTSTGSQTNVGSSTKTLSTVKVMNGTTDVTSNYSITKSNGTLTVTQKSVAVTWGTTTTFTYNGSAQGPTASVTTGVSGETMTVTRTTQTDAGSYTSTASCSKVTGGQAKCANYTLTNKTKKFTIVEDYECWHSKCGNNSDGTTWCYSEQCYAEPNGNSTKVAGFVKDSWLTINARVENNNKPFYWNTQYGNSRGWLHVKALNCWVWEGYFEHTTYAETTSGECQMGTASCKWTVYVGSKEATCTGTKKKITDEFGGCQWGCFDTTCTYTDGSGSFVGGNIEGGSC